MHSPLLFAHTADGSGLVDLKAATDKQGAIDSFLEHGADTESVFARLEQSAGSDWMPEIGDESRGWDAVEQLKSLGEGVTFTPATEFYGWLEVTPQRCRELLGEALGAAMELLKMTRQMLTDGVQKVDVRYPSLISPIDDATIRRIWTLRETVDDYGLTPRKYVDGLMFVTIDEYGYVGVQSFGQLVTEAVSRGEGVRLAVAHCFTGDYHY